MAKSERIRELEEKAGGAGLSDREAEELGRLYAAAGRQPYGNHEALTEGSVSERLSQHASGSRHWVERDPTDPGRSALGSEHETAPTQDGDDDLSLAVKGLEGAACSPAAKRLAAEAISIASRGGSPEEWRTAAEGERQGQAAALLEEAEECMRTSGIWPWN